jgi:ATP-dependent Clp protease ATP-binding subunit ClpX
MDKENMLKHVTPQDLKMFGLIPELIGRIPVLSYLNPLSKEALRRILTEPKNALITQYKQLFAMDGIELEIKDDALDAMVEQAMEYKLGARGLRGICEAVLTESMYELPEKVLIQAKDVKAKLAETDGKKAA